MAPYALQLTQHSTLSTQHSYDAHNAEYLLQRRAFTTDARHPARLPRALYSLAQWWRLRRFERELCLASEHVIAVSKADAAALARLSPRIEERIVVVPNGVDPAYWAREAVAAPATEITPGTEALVFDGSMDYRPNVDAAQWMAREVWPIVRAARPRARLYIVGRKPTDAVEALARQPGVSVTGEVADPRKWVAAATVYVVPMRMGGGVRLKVLQAMSMGCAIVSTPMGAEGIEVRHGREMLVARNARDFAASTLVLLNDPYRRAQLGADARRTASERYAWEKLLPALDRLYPSG
jgi:glycosyltransferase involved in cell wall biosynthesis